MSEHRHFTRIPFDANIQVSQDNDTWNAELIDISLSGVLFKQPENWKINPGKPVFIDITILDKTNIKMEATLVHITTQEAGCKCIHIDLDSITLLRRLVELNLGDDTFLERELSALIQQRED
jgi:hypothetical protein